LSGQKEVAAMDTSNQNNFSRSLTWRIFVLWETAGEKNFLRYQNELSTRQEFKLRQMNHHGILATFGLLPTMITA
jgi:hypothetical protein